MFKLFDGQEAINVNVKFTNAKIYLYLLLSFNLHLLLYTAFLVLWFIETEALKYMLKVQLTFFLSVKPMFHLIQMRKGAGGQLRRGPYLGFLFFSRRKKH